MKKEKEPRLYRNLNLFKNRLIIGNRYTLQPSQAAGVLLLTAANKMLDEPEPARCRRIRAEDDRTAGESTAAAVNQHNLPSSLQASR